MSRIVSEATQQLRTINGVKNVGAHVGRAILSDEAVNVNSAEIWIRVDPSADYDATVANINDVVRNYPGQDRDVITYLKEKTSEAATRLADDTVIRIYGYDLDELDRLAEDMKQSLTLVDDLSDLRIDGHVKEPNIEVKVDLSRAMSHGIKPGDVRRASAILMQGIEVGSLFEEQKVFDVVVLATPEHRESIESLKNLLIDKPDGGHVRVGEVADVRVVPTTSVIKREAVSRYIDVVGKVNGSYGDIKRDVEQIIASKSYPLEYRAELLQNFSETQFAKTRFIGFTLAAAFSILLCLQSFFGSWRLATATLLTLPSALIGGLVTAFIAGGSITLGSFAGFIAVFGIAARQCISLVNRYQHLENEGETFGAELVQKGTRDRFASIVLTAATIALAFVPVALIGNIGGTEILQPISVVLLGGLVTSTLYNVLAVPAIYLRYGANRESDFELFRGELIGTDLGTIYVPDNLNDSPENPSYTEREY
jgi:Cu/Ag efflux pump CusA